MGKKPILVVNKIDEPKRDIPPEFAKLGFDEVIGVAAVMGTASRPIYS